MATGLREILDQVASGQLSPQEGEQRIAGLRDRSSIAGLRIGVTGIRLTVLGDPTVATAVAEGTHRFERQGDQLVLHGDPLRGHYSTGTLASTLRAWVDLGLSADRRLFVRVNPALPVSIDLAAGSLVLTGMQGPVEGRFDSASVRLAAGRGPLSLAVRTGSLDVAWQFVGRSSIDADLSSAVVRVQPGSDVVVTRSGPAGGGPVTVGPGNGLLALTARLSSVDLDVP